MQTRRHPAQSAAYADIALGALGPIAVAAALVPLRQHVAPVNLADQVGASLATHPPPPATSMADG